MSACDRLQPEPFNDCDTGALEFVDISVRLKPFLDLTMIIVGVMMISLARRAW